MPDSNLPTGVITPNLMTPDGVLSGGGWMQPPQFNTLVVDGIAHLTLNSSHTNVLCVGGDGGPSETEKLMYLPPAGSVPAGFAFTIRLVVPIGTAFDVKIYCDPGSSNDRINAGYWYTLSGPLAFVTLVSDSVTSWYIAEHGTDAVFALMGALGVFNTFSPVSPPARCVTLSDVIAVLSSCGFCNTH